MRIFSILLFLSFLQANSASMQNSANPVSISDADEIHVGEVLADQFTKAEGLAPTPQTTSIDQYLQTVGDRVAAHAQRKLPYHFHFDPSPKFKSAVGLPGGQIFVGGGILAYMDSEDQLAMVLGHEIEHIALNQCHDRLAKIFSEQHLSADKASSLSVDDFLASYGHDNELAADREGAKLAMQAGYSPKAGIRLLQTYLLLAQQMPNTKIEAKARLEERMAQLQKLSAGAADTTEKPLALP